MILRIMFLIHWAVMLWIGGVAISVFLHIAENGFQSINLEFWEILILFLSPLAVFYLIDYIINGKITWLPWDREK